MVQRGLADTRHTCRPSRAKRCSSGNQEILKREQSAMLSEGVQHGHESIALLSPFALVNHMGVTAIVGPEILGSE